MRMFQYRPCDLIGSKDAACGKTQVHCAKPGMKKHNLCKNVGFLCGLQNIGRCGTKRTWTSQIRQFTYDMDLVLQELEQKQPYNLNFAKIAALQTI